MPLQACPILILSPFLPSRRGSRGAAGVRSPTEYASTRSRRAATGACAPGTMLLGATRMWSHGASSPRGTTGERATHLRPKQGEHGTTGGRADVRFTAARVRPAVPLVPPRAAGRWRRKPSVPGPPARGGGGEFGVACGPPDPTRGSGHRGRHVAFLFSQRPPVLARSIEGALVVRRTPERRRRLGPDHGVVLEGGWRPSLSAAPSAGAAVPSRCPATAAGRPVLGHFRPPSSAVPGPGRRSAVGSVSSGIRSSCCPAPGGCAAPPGPVAPFSAAGAGAGEPREHESGKSTSEMYT